MKVLSVSYSMGLVHYIDVIMCALASQITGVSIVYSTICSSADLVLLQEVACCTLPHHLSHQQRRTDIMSLMPSFCSGQADGVSALSLMPQIQQFMVLSLQWTRHSSFGPHVLIPWSIAQWMQALFTLPRILGERCLAVRTGKSFLNFPKDTQLGTEKYSYQ